MTDDVVRKHPLAECERCALAGNLGRYANSDIKEGSSLTVVGEAPPRGLGTGPMAGPGGRLLRTVMEHHGINPEEVSVTNATLCRPIDGSPPPKTAIHACRARLIDDVQSSGASTVVTLGTTAAQSLLRTADGVTKLRVGPGKETPDLPGVRIIPTVHPAACMRQGDFFPSLITDIGKVVAPRAAFTEPKFTVLDDEVSALRGIAELEGLGSGFVSLDIEVDVEKDFAFEHPDNYGLLCIGIGFAPGKAVVFGESALENRSVRDALARYLTTVQIVCQNGKFDLAGLRNMFVEAGVIVELWFDTMLASYSLDERPGIHGLKFMLVEYMGYPQYDDILSKYVGAKDGYGVIPKHILYKYNAFDAVGTYELKGYLEAKLEKAGKRALHDHLVAGSNALIWPELEGMKVDLSVSDELTESYLEIIETLTTEMIEVLGDDYKTFNPRSYKQVREVIVDRFGQKVPRKRNQKGVIADSSDEESITLLQTQSEEIPDAFKFYGLLLEHRRKAKLYGTYVKGIRKRLHNGRVHTTYLLHGTTSGRLASRNPNLQNIVRDEEIRRQFVAADGNVLIHCDYKQVEGRVIATLAQDKYLQAIFSDPDRDLFDELGARLYNLPPGVKPTKEQRIRVKAYFYGLGYGREYFSIALEYNIPPSEAKQDMEDFFALIPAVQRWQASIMRQVKSGKDLTTSFGRSRRFYLITDENEKSVRNEAMSFMPQSTASDICLSALIRLRPLLAPLDGHLRLTIHDALVSECPEPNREEVAALMRKVMIEEASKWTDFVPFDVDTTFGHSWGEL